MTARLLFAATVVVQLVVLYWPFGIGGPGVPGLDKVVHVAVFGAVALAGRVAGVGVWPLVVGLGLHAVVSEVVQGALLDRRGADPLDVVADLVGVALGLAAARLVAVRLAARRLAGTRRPAR